MYKRFGLVLMVDHACNLRCSYCYTGRKFSRPMPSCVARRAITRTVDSLAPGGTLDLGFFGGEPLLQAENILHWIALSRAQTANQGARLSLSMTTNGTVSDRRAWEIMTMRDLELSISFDGLPHLHDQERVYPSGAPSSEAVLTTMRRLQQQGKPFRVVSVVRPDTAAHLPDVLRFLKAFGVSMVDLALDLWTEWPEDALATLDGSIGRAVFEWRRGLPEFGVNWFNEKLLNAAGLAIGATARCSFGKDEISVAPSGRLYPCERLIGEDGVSDPMCLGGHVLSDGCFPPMAVCEGQEPNPDVLSASSTSCPCSRYTRTGRIDREDRLLRLLDQACTREVRRLVGQATPQTNDAGGTHDEAIVIQTHVSGGVIT